MKGDLKEKVTPAWRDTEQVVMLIAVEATDKKIRIDGYAIKKKIERF